jgi:hypothetical protein
VSTKEQNVVYANLLGKLSKVLQNPFIEEESEVKVQGVTNIFEDDIEENEVSMEIPVTTSFFIVKSQQNYFEEVQSGDYIYFVSDSMPAVFNLGTTSNLTKIYLDVEKEFEEDMKLVEQFVFNRKENITEQIKIYQNLKQNDMNQTPESDDVTVLTGSDVNQSGTDVVNIDNTEINKEELETDLKKEEKIKINVLYDDNDPMIRSMRHRKENIIE